MNVMQELRSSERKLGGMEREMQARDAKVEEANSARASIGITLAETQKKLRSLESEFEAQSRELDTMRVQTAGSSNEAQMLQQRIRDAEEEAARQATDAQSQSVTVQRLKQEVRDGVEGPVVDDVAAYIHCACPSEPLF
jgi:chromosome segregation ATPase